MKPVRLCSEASDFGLPARIETLCGFKKLAKESLMAVHWIKDIDSGLSKAKAEHKPILVDFSAAPA
jgi:hypothetical protein